MPGPADLPHTVVILALSSDIGTHLALTALARGATVVGTYRSSLPACLAGRPRLFAARYDLAEPAGISAVAGLFQAHGLGWDLFISCAGQLAPVGGFFDCDIAEWERAVALNGPAQLRFLHGIHEFRAPGQVHAVFFAGAGTNSPAPAYSAYCLGKISLIKMCELLDAECPELNAFIIGTGWVQTKIHRQTLAAGSAAGPNWRRTAEFVESGRGTALEDISDLIDWGVRAGRAVAGGRNFSVVHDAWRSGDLADALREDPQLYKLRRSGNAGVPARP